MYHVRNINQLKADTRWNTMMIKRHRKTLAVCHDCDALIHKAMETRVMLTMESRIHGDMYVRFGGRLVETYHRKVAKRCWPSLLKEIAVLCGIDKNITFHLARHTFATTITL